MRRNFQSNRMSSSWKTTTGAHISGRRTHLLSWVGGLARVFRLFSFARLLAPRFLLSTAETTLLPVVRYYPNLVNGQDTRTIAVWKFFDLISLVWVLNLVRSGAFMCIFYLFFYVFNTSGSWGYILFSVFLYSELFIGVACSFFINLSLGLLILVGYSFFWYPIFLFLLFLLNVLPIFFFIKSTLYIWVGLVIPAFLFLILLGQFSGSRLFRGVTLEFFFRKSGMWVFLVFLLFYILVPACLTLVGFSFIYFFSFAYFLLYRAGIVTTIDAGVFDFLSIIKQLCVQVWCAGWFGQVRNAAEGGIVGGGCEMGRLEIKKIGFLVRAVCADFFRGIFCSTGGNRLVLGGGIIGHQDFADLLPIASSGHAVFKLHSYFFNNFYALRDLYRVVLYSGSNMLLLRSNSDSLFSDNLSVSAVTRLQLLSSSVICSNHVGGGVYPLLPLVYGLGGNNSNIGVLTLPSWGNFLINSTNSTSISSFLSADVLATRVFTHLYTSLLGVQSDMQAICSDSSLWGDRRFLVHSESSYHNQLRLYREGFYGSLGQQSTNGGGTNFLLPPVCMPRLLDGNSNNGGGVTLWFLANTTSPYYGYYGSGSYYPTQLCYGEDAWWFGGSSFANLSVIGDWWGANGLCDGGSDDGADEEFLF